MKYLVFILRVLLAFVFILAAVSKARADVGGPQTMYDAWFAPGSAGHWAFIAFELLLAVWILSGWLPRTSALAAMLVLGLFTLMIWRESRQYDPRPCGCLGGGTIQQITPEDIRGGLRANAMRNLALIAIAAWLLILGDTQRPRAAQAPAHEPAADEEGRGESL